MSSPYHPLYLGGFALIFTFLIRYGIHYNKTFSKAIVVPHESIVDAEASLLALNPPYCKRVKVITKGTSPEKCIAIGQRKDGFGMRYLGVMSAIAWAYHTGRDYCHIGFITEETRHDTNLTEANIVPGYPIGSCQTCEIGDKGFFNQTFSKDYELSALFNPCVRRQIREAMEVGFAKIGITEPIGFKEDHINIAVHMRRGDVLQELGQQWHARKRRMPMEKVAEIVEYMRKKFAGEKIWINIFSEGEPDDFKLLTDGHDDIQLQLLGPEGMMVTWYSFVKADVLVIGLSSFSYSAAMLHVGDQIYYPKGYWRHFFLPPKEW
eukprot:CAMPEP_0167749756 /NCGR_PEP_ID=MMETSP0110_2-20121227/5599_1 /TAXON_ID=629695 /ORGANISM="Gymnochlora sp., Strain CCMP2014" /LENGTH=320 /DNA_ID=CAMNT_0007634975 /DNA_START=50 /DNA_END=1009 /DNA_ORIENTATION=-